MTLELRLVQAITPLHVGEGQAISAVDLPVTRERHTRWPFVPGSGLKGGLRAWNTLQGHAEDAIHTAFGPPAETTLAAGELRVGPMVLLALPIRSVKAGYALATCPLALARLARLDPEAPGVPEPTLDGARLPKGSPLWVDHGPLGGQIVLEELLCAASEDPRVDAWAAYLRRWLGEDAPLDRLVVIHDELFGHAARAWTETRTRAAIGPAGVVEDGKLFTVELLPADTLFWTTLDTRRAPLAALGPVLPPVGESFGLGGKRSVGSGRVVWFTRGPAAEAAAAAAPEQAAADPERAKQPAQPPRAAPTAAGALPLVEDPLPRLGVRQAHALREALPEASRLLIKQGLAGRMRSTGLRATLEWLDAKPGGAELAGQLRQALRLGDRKLVDLQTVTVLERLRAATALTEALHLVDRAARRDP